jgi:hypothetical protein
LVSGSNVNKVQGNYIGTDKSGTRDLGNGSVGVFVMSAFGNLVGGTEAGAGNVISGNEFDGVNLLDGSQNNRVLGNRIGTTAGGTGALGNAFDGVEILDSSNNVVGDGTPGAANTIAFNGATGVEISDFGSSNTTGNRVLSNSIFSNADLGMDLVGGTESASGATANDPKDPDTGANTLQNFPVLKSAKTVSGKTTINVKLNSSPGEPFLVQLFSNPGGNEGGKVIGQRFVVSDASGNVSFTFSPAQVVGVGKTITATATIGGNTSEFSAPRKVATS